MVKIVGGKELGAVTAASVPNNSIFLDDADNAIKTKDNSGTVSLLGTGVVPIGAISAWLKSLTGTPTLPSNFAECNGQTISDAESPYNGIALPNLNSGANKMLRGAATSGGTGGADTHALTIAELAAHTHSYNQPAYGSPTGGATQLTYSTVAATTGSTGSGTAHNNLPAYYEVVWIIRVK